MPQLNARRVAVDTVAALAVLLWAVVVAAAAGAVWEWWWQPTEGVAYHHEFVPLALETDFSGTGLYVVVGILAGFVFAALTMVVSRRDEVFMLGVVLVGSALAAWVMATVGHALGPTDPDDVAQGMADCDGSKLAQCERIPSDLVVNAGHHTFLGDLEFPGAPWFAFPLGAVVGTGMALFARAARSPVSTPSPWSTS